MTEQNTETLELNRTLNSDIQAFSKTGAVSTLQDQASEHTDIPRVIHYCWFGGAELPAQGQKCLKSWERFAPGFEIKRWDESNFDISANAYAKEAYDAGKYAFVSDYARFKILYEEGGIYLDTDVELIRDITEIAAAGPFMGSERSVQDEELLGLAVAPGLGFGAVPHMPVIGELLDSYRDAHFIDAEGHRDLRNVVVRTTDILMKHGLCHTGEIQKAAGLLIYPVDYFCPLNGRTLELKITDHTVSIHHYASSWVDRSSALKKKIRKILGPKLSARINRIADYVRKKKKT